MLKKTPVPWAVEKGPYTTLLPMTPIPTPLAQYCSWQLASLASTPSCKPVTAEYSATEDPTGVSLN